MSRECCLVVLSQRTAPWNEKEKMEREKIFCCGNTGCCLSFTLALTTASNRSHSTLAKLAHVASIGHTLSFRQAYYYYYYYYYYYSSYYYYYLLLHCNYTTTTTYYLLLPLWLLNTTSSESILLVGKGRNIPTRELLLNLFFRDASLNHWNSNSRFQPFVKEDVLWPYVKLM